MNRIKSLTLYQKSVLIFMAAMVLIFAAVYAVTISRVGFEYRDTIFVPSLENGGTVYSGKLEGEQARFTVSEDKTVVFQHGDKTYGPYTAIEDPTAIPKDKGIDEYMERRMTGIEFREGDSLLFRGGVSVFADTYWLYNEDGSVYSVDIEFSYVTNTGVLMDEDGNMIDPVEPSIFTILDLMGDPELTHKGDWSVWFGTAFLCLLNALSILFADELFRWELSFRIRDTKDAEPSEWEMAGRYIGWTLATIAALVLFNMGLQ